MNGNSKTKVVDIERLVRASQAGDRSSFDKLVGMYQRQAMQVAIRILDDADGAAEAVQNGFVKAYLNIEKLKESKRFEAWFFQIITNTALSWRRAAKDRMKKMRMAGCVNQKKISPACRESGRELQQEIKRAMLKLSKKQAQAIALFGIDDLPQDKVAEIMNCSKEAVRWHVFKARQKLKVLLKDYLE